MARDAIWYRGQAVELATLAVDGEHGRAVGDPIHEQVTQGRREQFERALAAGLPWAVEMSRHGGYSSCGDLAHWLLWRLGVRDRRINRDAPGRQWRSVQNITLLTTSPWYLGASLHGLPERGDILHVRSSPTSIDDHVCVLLDTPSSDQWVTADYGQPHALRRVCTVRDTSEGLLVRGRLLRGWVSIDRLCSDGAFVEAVDDNPY